MKKVSVILPCLNEERYIREAFESLRDQTYKNLQIILVDNGSTDASVRIARQTVEGDDRFRFVAEPKKGIARALNRGLQEADGDIIAFLDVDDFYCGNAIQRIVEEFENTHADFIACNGYLVDENSEVYGEIDAYIYSEEMTPLVLFQKNIIWTMSFLAVRKSVVNTKSFFPDAYDRLPDWHLILDCISRGLKIRFLDEPLVHKRYHDQNLAYNSGLVEPQSIRRLLEFMQACPRISEFYNEDDIKRILTERYIRGVQYFRRKGLWDRIPGYLEEYVDSGHLDENVYRYFNAIALLHTDTDAFVSYAEDGQSRHPLWHFVRGLRFWVGKEYRSACSEFEAAFVRSLLRFPEALNSWALACFFVNRDRSGRLISQTLSQWPDYKDALENRKYILEGRPGQFKHTLTLMPDSLSRLTGIPME
ncbi:MAG: glycosyltransferase [Acidobacteria bacterium]|nr:glycosyltransferase [Acidobacteriota bacterium]